MLVKIIQLITFHHDKQRRNLLIQLNKWGERGEKVTLLKLQKMCPPFWLSHALLNRPCLYKDIFYKGCIQLLHRQCFVISSSVSFSNCRRFSQQKLTQTQLSVSSRNSSLTAHSNSVSEACRALILCLGKHSVILCGVRIMLTVLYQLVNQLQLSADNNLLSWFQHQMW